MKRIISCMLALILLVSLTACGSSGTAASTAAPATVSPSTQAEAPETNSAATAASEPEAPAERKDLSIDGVGVINIPGRNYFSSAAVGLISNPSVGVTYDQVRVTVSFYDAEDHVLGSAKASLVSVIRPGEQLPFRADCSDRLASETVRAEVAVDSFETLDNDGLRRAIDNNRVSIIDDGTIFELVNYEITKKDTGKLRFDYAVRNKSAEKKTCQVFILFEKDGLVVYGQDRTLYIDGSDTKKDYFYADYDDYNDFPDYDEIRCVLICKK